MSAIPYVFSLLLCPAVGAVAQDPVSLAQDRAPHAVRLAGVYAEGQELGAVGPAYHTGFAAGSVEFTPALGDAAREPRPVRLQLSSIRRGAGSHPVAADPRPMRRGDAVEYRHAEGAVVERYEPRDDGLELSFVFASRPAGSGDLVVRMALHTDLPAADTVWRQDGLELWEPGVGGVTVGAVTGIDAGGWTVRGALRVRDRHLELSLPADFVDRARYPMVLDPVIGPKLAISGTDTVRPAIAYDASTQRYLIVHEVRISVGVTDLFFVRTDLSGNRVGNPNIIGGRGSLKRNAAVGAASALGVFLVVWEDSAFLGADRNVRGQTVRASDGALGNAFDVAATGDREETPDVSSAATGDALVAVWRRESLSGSGGIEARRLRLPSSGLGSALPGPVVALSTRLEDAQPAISQNGGSVRRHVVVWKTVTLGGPSIRGQALDGSGNPVGTQFAFSAGDPQHPDVDGDGTDFLVVYQDPEPGSTGDHDIEGVKVHFDGSGLAPVPGTLAIEADPGDDEIEPAVALLGPKYLVLWSDEASGLNYDIGGIVLRTDDCRRCGREFAITDLNLPRQTGPQVASRLAAGDSSDDCMLVWQEADILPPFRGNIVAQRFEAQVGQPAVVVSPGCAGGGVANAVGDFTPGSRNFTFEVAQADPATLIFALSLGFPGPGSVCGSCEFLRPVALSFHAPFLPGAAISAFEPSCDPVFLGFALDFQWVAFGVGGTPCPAAAGIAASSRLRVTLVE